LGDLADRAQTQLESFGNTVAAGYLPHLQALQEKYLMPNPNAEVDTQLKAQGFNTEEEPSYVQMRDQNIKRQESHHKEIHTMP
jgi:hypothetical protein